MYLDTICSIQKTDDKKYVVTFIMPKKESKKKEKMEHKGGAMAESETEDLTLIATSEKELINLIQKHLPYAGKSEEDKYEIGYKEG